MVRTYTLSVAPSDPGYRISVKRDGAASQHLHDQVKVGDMIEARAPAGAFTMEPAAGRPAVLLAAGIGVTPLLAMLRHIVYEGRRTRHMRPAWLFHGARTLRERAFSEEIASLQTQGDGAIRVVRLLSDTAGAQAGSDYDEAGRIDIDVLRRHLPLDDYDFYLCGPASFMQSLYDALRALRIPDDRIHAESFGGSSLVRQQPPDAQPQAPSPPPAIEPVPVLFRRSARQAQWNPGDGSLLELAEQHGLSPEFGCRNGSCGTCRTRIVQGAVAYFKPPEYTAPQGHALICCAAPAADGPPLQLEL